MRYLSALLSPSESASHRVFLLRKRGLRAMQCFWSAFDSRLVAEELDMPQSAVRQAIGDAMEDLNRISRNFLPDGWLKSQAAPLMRFDLENLKSVYDLDSLSRPQLELLGSQHSTVQIH